MGREVIPEADPQLAEADPQLDTLMFIGPQHMSMLYQLTTEDITNITEHLDMHHGIQYGFLYSYLYLS